VLRDGSSVLKVWNINSYTGMVGAFNLQGASWDRVRRKFHMHDKRPKELRAAVKPADVEPFSGAAGSTSGLTPSPVGRYACYAYNSRDMQVRAHRRTQATALLGPGPVKHTAS
jgi:raffinose synthase